MSNKVSMQDVADSVGVSKVTVSKVLRGKSDVSEAMSKKIMDAVTRLGYVYDNKKEKADISKISVLTAGHFFGIGGSDCFYVKLYQCLSEEFEKLNIDVMLSIVDQQSEMEITIPEKLKNRDVDGIIVMGQLSREYLRSLMALKIPLVFLDFYYDDFNVTSINTDNFFNTYELTNKLIQLGHTKIGFVGTLDATSSIQDRFLGYYKSLIEHHIPLNQEWILNDRESDGTYLNIELPKALPTAFVCNCDEVAMLFINNLKAHGYKVPDDISVTGFDDTNHSMLSNPKITTVQVNLEEMAHLATKAMIRDIGSNKHKNRILIKGKIIFRESTTRFPDPSE
ncbi:MAG TPA: LacI family transcriptional regulator [Clostridiales bacterium]|nr:LacI family transcriptional regulator [Clostridiales bacterium]